MTLSQNGYPANRIDLTQIYTIPGTDVTLRLKRGACGEMLVNFAAWFHQHIEPIDQGQQDDWAYAERTVRGSTTTVSNHASGTAIDLNALKHPLGAVGTFTDEQERLIRARLRTYEGCIRWGGDYSHRKDEMHFEIDKPLADVTYVMQKIRKDWLAMATIDEVEALVRRVVRQEIDRKFGENTSDAAGLPDIGKARLVHPNDPGTVSTLGHLLFGIDAQVREG